jgi:ADP-heptose:LPS heptosyltransferase
VTKANKSATVNARPNVLLVRLDSAGDVLLTGPAIRAVAVSASKVTLLCGHRGFQAASLLPGVDEVLVHTACWVDPKPEPLDTRATLELVRTLRGRQFDQGLIFTSFHQSPLPTALLLRMAGIPTLAAISVDYPGSLLDVRHRVPDEIHEVERALSLASTLGYRLPPEDDGSLQIRRPSGTSISFSWPSYIVVHPGASVQARAWGPDRHAELVRRLASTGHRVVVTGSRDERDLTARVSGLRDSRVQDVLDLGGRTSMAELAEVLAGADLVVVGNTGPAHLAAAVGTPVVSLFAPTVPAVRWRPWRVPHILLGDQAIACAGCRATNCPVPGHPCLSSVTVEEVLAAVTSLAAPSSRPVIAGTGP